MRVFITGGTGLIGSAITDTLITHHHQVHVHALARSDQSAAKLKAMGANPIAGDITRPEDWVHTLPELDAVIHAACDFSDQMAEIDANLLDRLIPALALMPGRVRFVYTGGVWSFPETPNGEVFDETTPFDGVPDFDWGITGFRRILAADGLDGIVIHPACVYATGKHDHIGHFDRAIHAARNGKAIPIFGAHDVTQPLVHADDLAELYRLALCHAKPGSSYLGVAINDVSNKSLARLIAKHFANGPAQFETITAEIAKQRLGDWAAGLAMHQRFSSAKAMTELGWQPQHQNLEDDIRRCATVLKAPSS
jgi:nucleoside-diphosphate-sugar epimerase